MNSAGEKCFCSAGIQGNCSSVQFSFQQTLSLDLLCNSENAALALDMSLAPTPAQGKKKTPAGSPEDWKSLILLLIYLPPTHPVQRKTRFRSCSLEWKQVSSWWLTGSLQRLPDLLSTLQRLQGTFTPYKVSPLQILTGVFTRFFQSHQPMCWLQWDWPCSATGQAQYPAPAIQVKYDLSFHSCLDLKVQEYFLGHGAALSLSYGRARNRYHVAHQGGSS